eukprot:CAMPEP_0115417602 /NCGR_PEP_ID=MMETSP0271-20121206/24214_1 /TAXON_ID=71861 /ORGANISM="Scrippsiella trochoidea, Strain CCMP3099" /LENGTH=1198 /DNA_ID=CAMNT_0002842005 /DNA_START=9 /DNA_END=3606 /DNA_ORIENTATION=+
MSLEGQWPSSGGLPEPTGAKRQEWEQHLVALVREKIEAGEADRSAPVDLRIEHFLSEHLAGVRGGAPVTLPKMLSLDRYGMARVLSLPRDADTYESKLIKSFRCQNGVLHNPVNDKRTTAGVFHVAEGAYPIADDKKAVPLAAFSKLLDAALCPQPTDLELPFGIHDPCPKRAWVKVLLRPLVCPEVPGFTSEKRMEVRFMAPGSMVANVDFVESVFGNAGEANLPENDAALDVEHWSGHTGCIILAPQLLTVTKRDLGLPQWDEATDRQRRDGMAWRGEHERYNDGKAFKICVRSSSGVFVTLIADNYFGYCKKEVKTQLSFACNLFGTEEEHAGGALTYASISWGSEFRADHRVSRPNHHYPGRAEAKPYTFSEAMGLLQDEVHMTPEGFAVDREFSSIVYIPEDAVASTATGRVSWKGGEVFLVPGFVYIHPSGYQFSLQKTLNKRGWHICGTVAEPINYHKPATVSGGGKSEVSKLLSDRILFGNIRIDNVKRDLAYVDMILKRDYSDRYEEPRAGELPLLHPQRTLGSIVKLLTPSDEYTAEYNSWLETIPSMIRSLVFLVKSYYRPAWGRDWKSHISVMSVDGRDGDVVYVDGERVVVQYLRVGQESSKGGRPRMFQLRHDFVPAHKIQTEDDISASIIVPRTSLKHLNAEEASNQSLKLAQNCELRLFQRPDDAKVRGADTICEADMAGEGNFMSNFEPLTGHHADQLSKHAVCFDEFTEPMQKRLKTAAADARDKFVVSSAHFRMVEGKPTANPRYLQVRTDFGDPRARRIAKFAACLRRRVPASEHVHFPVNAVLPGRRNNPPDQLADGTPIRPLAVFSPIHYQELPELFMDLVCSVTGRSPSTTGAGSEGALTKGPFNALTFVADLNAALIGFILTGYSGYSSAAGYIGRQRVDHDISLLAPEVWCRMSEEERDPSYLIRTGCLEKVEDMEIAGKKVLASRLGYRITTRFVSRFLGRIFSSPSEVFDAALLRPETQDLAMFVDGVNNLVEAQARVASAYIADGSIQDACPPLQAVLFCMARGCMPDGRTIHSPEIRALFTRESLLSSKWYHERLLAKQRQEVRRLSSGVGALREFLAASKDEAERLGITERLRVAEDQLKVVSSEGFAESLIGTTGTEPTLEPDEGLEAVASGSEPDETITLPRLGGLIGPGPWTSMEPGSMPPQLGFFTSARVLGSPIHEPGAPAAR